MSPCKPAQKEGEKESSRGQPNRSLRASYPMEDSNGVYELSTAVSLPVHFIFLLYNISQNCEILKWKSEACT